MNNNDYWYQLYLQELQKQNADNPKNPLNKVNSYANTVGRWGNNLSGTGDIIKGFENKYLQGLGNTMSNIGDKLNTVSDKMKPTNYFRGQAAPVENNQAINSAIDNVLGISDLSSVNSAPTIANYGNTATTLSNYGTSTAPTITNGIGSNTISNLGANGMADGMSTIGSNIAGQAGGAISADAAGLGTIGGNAAATAGAETAAGTSAGLAGGAASGGTAAGAGGASSAGLGAAAGPIAALATLAVMGLQGTNRKRAKQAGESLMKSTNNTVNQQASTALDQTQQNAQNLQAQAQQALANGVTNTQGVLGNAPDLYGGISQNNMPVATNPNYTGAVGYASNMGTSKTDPQLIKEVQEEQAREKQQIPLQLVQQNANNNGVNNMPAGTLPTPTGDAVQSGSVVENQQKQGFIDKLVSGLTDFSRGFNENYNNGFDVGNLTNNQFTTDKVKNIEGYKAKTDSPEYTAYINTLKNAKNPDGTAKYSQDVINAVAQGHNGGNKDVAQWVDKNLDNENIYEPIKTYETVDKNKMGRTGELVGSMARWAKNPNVQALIAGGLSTALTGNPLYGLGQAYKYGNARANSDIYQKVLKEQGIDIDPGIFGSISSDDYNHIMYPQYRLDDIERRRLYDQMYYNYRDKDLQEKVRHNQVQEGINEKNANSRQTSANASMVRAKKTGGGRKGGGGGRKTTKPQQHPDWNSDLAGYVKRYNDPRYATRMGAIKQSFISKYGVDPDKYIKE